ncbi:ABC transporter ATP-binding protein [Actinomadura rugatobispora]|uniref:ABC transporter ATP-binding protein n=1 Tax=Actinomadura rugatobispora TaxID=1994 RepID=A0ABW1ABY3_9ACTN|nr:ABC transporter ATP-binding protein [Actinomadura rugatobispora]
MTGTPLLRIERLSARVHGTDLRLLQDIDLTVSAGSVVAVVGPSGSGKTTLGLAALAAARAGIRLDGQVLLEGTDLLPLPEPRRRALRAGTAGHLPQHPEIVLDPIRRIGSTLGELAALQHRARPARAAAVDAALASAGLPEPALARRLPHQLSGGQQQRAALASALVTGARLLVLDEPTSGLDPITATALGHRLRALVAGGTGILLLSHDLPFTRMLAAQVAVLEQGRIVRQGPAAQVLGGPRATAAHGMPNAGAEPAAARGDGVQAIAVAVRRRTGTSPLPGPVTMSFPPGSRTALIGPSGAGKTTFGRLLAGLVPSGSGRLAHNGVRLPARIQRRNPAQRRTVQYVHQNSADSFEGHRPLLGQIAAAGRLLRGMSAQDAEAEAHVIATRLGLDDDQLARTPGRLSGGQLQRCALVRALMARPALLVCDEATSALDALARERVLGALPDLLAPSATALLFITHDLAAVREIAHTVAVFDAGRCVQHAPTAEFFRSPAPGAPTLLVRSANAHSDA